MLQLRIERVKKGLTQCDISMKTGIPQWRLSLLERGIPPLPEEAKKIAETLNADAKILFKPVV